MRDYSPSRRCGKPGPSCSACDTLDGRARGRSVAALPSALTVVAVTLCGPVPVSGQVSMVPPEDLRPIERTGPSPDRILFLEERLAADSSSYDVRWELARELATLAAFSEDGAEGKERAYEARAQARAAKALQPDGLEGRYWLAVAAALVANAETGRAILDPADEAWAESGWVLGVDSLNAGAHYIRGRLHAAIMRQSAFKRFLAKTLFGAVAVDEASWALAEYHLRRAADLDPEVPMYPFELAAVLRDTGRLQAAREEWERAAGTGGLSVLDERYRRRAEALLRTGG